jgi:hypothetical protein
MNYIFKNKYTGKYFNFNKWLQNQNLPNAPSKTDVDNLKDATIHHEEYSYWLIANKYPYDKILYEDELKNIRKLKIKTLKC